MAHVSVYFNHRYAYHISAPPKAWPLMRVIALCLTLRSHVHALDYGSEHATTSRERGCWRSDQVPSGNAPLQSSSPTYLPSPVILWSLKFNCSGCLTSTTGSLLAAAGTVHVPRASCTCKRGMQCDGGWQESTIHRSLAGQRSVCDIILL